MSEAATDARRNITKDPAYDAADPNDFPAMMEVERYGRRD